MKNLLRASLMMALLAVLVSVAGISARAVPLLPGAGFIAPAPVLFACGGCTLLTSNNLAVVTGAFSGTARVAVVRTVGGTLDFYYQFSNAGADTINRLAGFNFAGWTTNVDLISNGSALAGLGAAGFVDGTVVPFTVDRSPNGATVGWNYGGFGIGDSLFLGGTSGLVFRISTNAVQFTDGNFAISDGIVANSPGFQPTIPEPASVLLLGTGLVGAAGAFRRRFKKTSSD